MKYSSQFFLKNPASSCVDRCARVESAAFFGRTKPTLHVASEVTKGVKPKPATESDLNLFVRK